jgi:hypothetical protein
MQMAKRSLVEQLDDAVEAILARRDTPHVDPKLATLIGVAVDLCDLPSEDLEDA